MPYTLTEKLRVALDRARDREKDLKKLGGEEGASKAMRLGLPILRASQALLDGDAIKMLEALEGLENAQR